MKKKFTSILSFVFLISITNTCLFGLVKDTLIIKANPPGNLNKVINADTTASGESAHIYVLVPSGPADTTYFITEEIRIKNLELIGKNNPNTGNPPVVAPFILEDGSSPDNIVVAIDNGNVHLKNLYLLGTSTDGSQVTQQCIGTSDSCRIIVEGCVIENFGSTGTPNIINTWNARGSDIFVTNCLFRNNQSNVPQCPGINWAGPGVNAIDTMIVSNSTFFILGGNIEGSGTSIGYFEFNHNTIFMQTKSSPFSMRQMHNAKITNNIFYCVYSAGLDSLHVYGGGVWSISYIEPAIIELDSLYSDLEGDPHFLTEADRNIEAINNAYFWPRAIVENFDTMNADEKYQVVGGKILAPVWVATRLNAEPLLNLLNIRVAEEDNYNIDPAFNNDLVEIAADNMANFVRHIWENGGYGKGLKPFTYLSDPNNLFKDVPENWADMQGYPVRENLRYTNQTLITAGTDGLPLGDLNWFPEHIVDIEEAVKQLPESFYLSQNYPNPFNPVTTIKFTIPLTPSPGERVSEGRVRAILTVYNSIGQQVATLVNEPKAPGVYEVQFDASDLASGVYMYRLTSGGYMMTKKMVVIK